MRTKLIAAALIAANGAVAQWEWQQLEDFPGTARDDAASFSHYCKVYVGTGMEVGWSLTNDWWRYDVIQGSWLQMASLPASPRQYCTARAINGIGYLFGGLDANGPLNELWAYNTSTDTWSQRASLPAAGRYATASFVTSEKLYVCSGLLEGGTATSELWRFDPVTDQWTQLTNLPGGERHRATAINPGQWSSTNPVVVGGADADYNALADCWAYHAPTDTWEQVSDLPEARYGMSSSNLPSYLVLAGAVNATTFRANGYLYNSFAGSWTEVPELLPSPRRGGVMGESDDCSGYQIAYYGLGLDESFTRQKDWNRSGYVFNVPEHAFGRLIIQPNPAQDFIAFTVTANDQLQVRIVNGAGAQVRSSSDWRANEPLDISMLAPGAYVMHATSDVQVRSARFIKLP